MKISLIQPSRNNLKYLKWSYDSIRKNQGNHEVEICIADDASTDGTLEWLHELQKVDDNQALNDASGKFVTTYMPAEWTCTTNSWAKPTQFLWQAIYENKK